MLKPIETTYRGFRFRSRLEARWAVYFDALGCKWEYEPEGFDLGAGVWYLPDFKVSLPGGLVNWYEVKPPGVVEDQKHGAFCEALRSGLSVEDEYFTQALLVSGDPMENRVDHRCPRCLQSAEMGNIVGREGVPVYCERCDFTTPGGGGNEPVPSLAGSVEPYKGIMYYNSLHWHHWLLKVEAAEEKARQARFEHMRGSSKAWGPVA